MIFASFRAIRMAQLPPLGHDRPRCQHSIKNTPSHAHFVSRAIRMARRNDSQHCASHHCESAKLLCHTRSMSEVLAVPYVWHRSKDDPPGPLPNTDLHWHPATEKPPRPLGGFSFPCQISKSPVSSQTGEVFWEIKNVDF